MFFSKASVLLEYLLWFLLGATAVLLCIFTMCVGNYARREEYICVGCIAILEYVNQLETYARPDLVLDDRRCDLCGARHIDTQEKVAKLMESDSCLSNTLKRGRPLPAKCAMSVTNNIKEIKIVMGEMSGISVRNMCHNLLNDEFQLPDKIIKSVLDPTWSELVQRPDRDWKSAQAEGIILGDDTGDCDALKSVLRGADDTTVEAVHGIVLLDVTEPVGDTCNSTPPVAVVSPYDSTGAENAFLYNHKLVKRLTRSMTAPSMASAVEIMASVLARGTIPSSQGSPDADIVTANLRRNIRSKLFRSHVNQKKHKRSHTTVKMFECKVCHKRFETPIKYFE